MLKNRAKLLRDIYDLSAIGVKLVSCENCFSDNSCRKGRVLLCCMYKMYSELASIFKFADTTREDYYIARYDIRDIINLQNPSYDKQRAEFLIKCIVSNGWHQVDCSHCVANVNSCTELGVGCVNAMANKMRDVFGLERVECFNPKLYKYDYLEQFYE